MRQSFRASRIAAGGPGGQGAPLIAPAARPK
jgi:hypothetical protein